MKTAEERIFKVSEIIKKYIYVPRGEKKPVCATDAFDEIDELYTNQPTVSKESVDKLFYKYADTENDFGSLLLSRDAYELLMDAFITSLNVQGEEPPKGEECSHPEEYRDIVDFGIDRCLKCGKLYSAPPPQRRKEVSNG